MSDFLKKYQESHTNRVNKALHMVGIPSVVGSLGLFVVTVSFFDGQHWPWALALFVFGWTLQIIGHAFEGKPPAFLSHPIYLLIGPFWWIKNVLRTMVD